MAIYTRHNIAMIMADCICSAKCVAHCTDIKANLGLEVGKAGLAIFSLSKICVLSKVRRKI